MINNYDGSSAGQKNAQFGALDEIYRRWDAASEKMEAESRPNTGRTSLLPKVAAVCVALALIATVVMLGWALL